MTEGISLEELQLAARNHGMPLEALRHEITPRGPALPARPLRHPGRRPGRLAADASAAGPSGRSSSRSRTCARRDAVTVPVTMECAGNGRARLEPRPVSQPWLVEAVGTAEWTGTPLAPLLAEAGLLDDARRGRVHRPRPRRRGRRRAGLRAQPAARRRAARRRAAGLRDERRAAAAPARLPAAARRPRLVRHDRASSGSTAITVARPSRSTATSRPTAYRMRQRSGRAGHAGHADRAALADRARPASRTS